MLNDDLCRKPQAFTKPLIELAGDLIKIGAVAFDNRQDRLSLRGEGGNQPLERGVKRCRLLVRKHCDMGSLRRPV